MDHTWVSMNLDPSPDDGASSEALTRTPFVHIRELERPAHEYRLNMPAACLQRLTAPPKLADWRRFRPLIEDLYITQRLPLSKVIQILAYEFTFVGSVKMFKTRLKKWGHRIYYREADYVAVLNSLTKSSDTSTIRINDRPVDWPRVRRWVNNNSCPPIERPLSRQELLRLIDVAESETQPHIHQREEPEDDSEPAHYSFAQNPRQSLPHPLTPPVPYIDALCILRSLKDYINGKFSTSTNFRHLLHPHTSWNTLICQSACGRPFLHMIHPSEIVQDYHRCLQLMNAGQPDFGFLLVSQTCEKLGLILRQQHPALVPCLLKILTGYSQFGHLEFQNYIAGYVVEMSKTVLGPEHSVTRLCRYLHQSRDTRDKIHFLLSCGRMFTQSLGRNHTISIYLNQKVFEVLLDAQCFEHALAHARRELDLICSELNGLPTPILNTSSVCFCFLRRKARLYRLIGQTQRAARQLTMLGRLLLRAAHTNTLPLARNPVFEEVYRMTAEMAQFFLGVHDYGRFIHAYALALELCVAVRGLEDDKTTTMITVHERRLNGLGFDQAAQVLRMKYPRIFTRVVDIDLEYTGIDSRPSTNMDVLTSQQSNTGEPLPHVDSNNQDLANTVRTDLTSFLQALQPFCRYRLVSTDQTNTINILRVEQPINAFHQSRPGGNLGGYLVSR